MKAKLRTAILNTKTFDVLEPEPRAAFLEYLKDREFESDIKRFIFWFECSPTLKAVEPKVLQCIDHSNSGIPEVNYTTNNDLVIFRDGIMKIKPVVSWLEEEMKPHLQERFEKFKQFLIDS